MDSHGLISSLETIRTDMPGLLPNEREELTCLVQKIVELIEQRALPVEALLREKRAFSGYPDFLAAKAAAFAVAASATPLPTSTFWKPSGNQALVGLLADLPAPLQPPVDDVWAADPSVPGWRERVEQAFAHDGFAVSQAQLALTTAVSIIEGLAYAGLSQAEIEIFLSQYARFYHPKQWSSASKGSFWYSLALLVSAATGGRVSISPLTLPWPIKNDTLTGARRVVRALLDPVGTDGAGRPVCPAAVIGGPANVQDYSVKCYRDPGGMIITHAQFHSLSREQKKQYQVATEIDIVTRDGKNIEIGGVDKGGYFDKRKGIFVTGTASFAEQLQRLIALPGGRDAAYCVLEQPPGGTQDPQWPQFAAAVATANALSGPEHVLILMPQAVASAPHCAGQPPVLPLSRTNRERKRRILSATRSCHAAAGVFAYSAWWALAGNCLPGRQLPEV